MKNETVALIEISGGHSECLLTQFHALKSANKRIVFITTQGIMDRNPLFTSYVDKVYVLNKEERSAKFKAARKIKKIEE